jgi:hypothetical protein
MLVRRRVSVFDFIVDFCAENIGKILGNTGKMLHNIGRYWQKIVNIGKYW